MLKKRIEFLSLGLDESLALLSERSTHNRTSKEHKMAYSDDKHCPTCGVTQSTWDFLQLLRFIPESMPPLLRYLILLLATTVCSGVMFVLASIFVVSTIKACFWVIGLVV